MSRSHDGESRPANRLAGETSPYLLQHARNPVDWHPWGGEALERSRHEQKPIFLSIGYAACHWCHVMERESFENEEIAAFLNEHFVCIKVDREERPDIDEIYMNAIQLLTGAGGWPLNVFLTPELEPFTGGTYFPPDHRYGQIPFPELLRRVHDAWGSDRERLARSAAELTRELRRIGDLSAASGGEGSIGREATARAVAELTSRYDAGRGGFSGAPKFPPDGALALLLREHARSGQEMPLRMAESTLEGMARGGMYDHVGGGFARYSVDEHWLVPHFEKMLYNQALLVPVYLDAWTLTGRPLYRRVVEETLDFVRRELTDEGGGFHSSLDADSEGREGVFYVWSPAELRELLGEEDGALIADVYGITETGNFEGKSIPNLLEASLADLARSGERSEEEWAARLAAPRARLREARERRERPATDDKVLTAWNGLMIGAYARAYQVFGREEDLESARRAAAFVLGTLRDGDRLLVSYRAGRAALNGYLDDYAFLVRGLLDLYEAAFDVAHLERAERLAVTMLARFEDAEGGGFFFTSDDHEQLLTRSRSLHDGAIPSGAGVAAESLLRLERHLDRDEFGRAARRTLAAYRPLVARAPAAFVSLLLAADLAGTPGLDVAVLGDVSDGRTRELLASVRRRYRPGLAVAAGPAGQAGASALLSGRTTLPDGAPAAYVCRGRTCSAPTGNLRELEELLDRDAQ